MSYSIELRQPIEATAEALWKACILPHGIANWQADEAEGDARLGGTLRLHWSAFSSTVELTIVEWVPNQRVAFRQGETVVEFQFDNAGVTLIQRGLDANDDIEGLRSSWRLALAHLAHSVERHPGRERRVEWLVRQVRATPELVYLALTDPNLSQWLRSHGGITAEGMKYSLTFPNGPTISGRVLTNVSGRDICLACEEAGDALLAFRTFPAPGAPGERIIAAVWSEWGPPRELADDIVEAIDASLEQLVAVLARVGSA
jgi:uncharacterized protein YndB with AHSA1/START domain